MKIIAHRGNLNGPLGNENSPEQIELASKQFDVEIDVWKICDQWFLGHDTPIYEINKGFLYNPKFWCHAKNLRALDEMLASNIHCFWHQNDSYTITSKGFIWAYPNQPLIHNHGIIVVFDKEIPKDFQGEGICTDYPLEIR